MRRAVCAILALALVVTVSGCGDQYESAVEKQLGYMDELNSALGDIKDEASLTDAKTEVEAIVKKMKALADEMEKLPKPSKEKEEALEKKYKERMTETGKKIMTTMMKLQKSGIKGVEEIGKAMSGMGGM